ncbi:MAG: RnfH family protein [Gammaproteobacteria bacterium]|nr:MAG: RnfH family protein [Gammaproteobacteria bacterium]
MANDDARGPAPQTSLIDDPGWIDVEVAYARPDAQLTVPCRVPVGTSVRDALRLSGLAEAFSEIDVDACPLGIFGQAVDGAQRVGPGDRVEVYRPLRINPREARRERQRGGKS